MFNCDGGLACGLSSTLSGNFIDPRRLCRNATSDPRKGLSCLFALQNQTPYLLPAASVTSPPLPLSFARSTARRVSIRPLPAFGSSSSSVSPVFYLSLDPIAPGAAFPSLPRGIIAGRVRQRCARNASLTNGAGSRNLPTFYFPGPRPQNPFRLPSLCSPSLLTPSIRRPASLLLLAKSSCPFHALTVARHLQSYSG